MRLHELLEAYLSLIEAAVVALPVYAESYVEEILTSERINLHIRRVALPYPNTEKLLS